MPGSGRRSTPQRRSARSRSRGPPELGHSETPLLRAFIPLEGEVFLLAAAPDRLALLCERRRALARVLRREDGAGDLALLRPALFVAPLHRLLDDLLRRDHRERG